MQLLLNLVDVELSLRGMVIGCRGSNFLRLLNAQPGRSLKRAYAGNELRGRHVEWQCVEILGGVSSAVGYLRVR